MYDTGLRELGGYRDSKHNIDCLIKQNNVMSIVIAVNGYESYNNTAAFLHFTLLLA